MTLRDLTNQTFGRLTVLERSVKTNKRGKVYWDCKCACGNIKPIVSWQLTSGGTKSCGCWHDEFMLGNTKCRKDLTGQRFYKLQVVSFAYTSRNKKAVWLCQCDCGNTKEVLASSLISGKARSCGCLSGLPPGKSGFNMVYNHYEVAAARRGFPFELTEEQFLFLSSQNCFYCNSSPKNVMKISENGEFVYNGVDRVDNEIGYVEGNCVPCCGTCNKAKNKMNKDQFLDWIKSVYEFSVVGAK